MMKLSVEKARSSRLITRKITPVVVWRGKHRKLQELPVGSFATMVRAYP